MNNSIEHEETANEHDNFEEGLDEHDHLFEEGLDCYSGDDDITFPVPTIIRRPPVSRDSVMSDITGMAELEQQAAAVHMNREAVSDEVHRPRIGIHPVSRILDRSYNARLRFSDNAEATPTPHSDVDTAQQNGKTKFDDRFPQACVPAGRVNGEEQSDAVDMNQQDKDDRGRRDLSAYCTSQSSFDRLASEMERDKTSQGSGRIQGDDTHEFESPNSYPTSDFQTLTAALNSDDVVYATAYRVNTLPVATATPISSFDESSAENAHRGSKLGKARVIKKTVVKKAEETKRDRAPPRGAHGKTTGRQPSVRKTTTYRSDGSSVETTFNADGTTTTVIKHSSKGKGRKHPSKFTEGLSESTLGDHSTTSSASRGQHSHPRGAGDERSHASSTSESQGANTESDTRGSSRDQKIVKSRSTKVSSDGLRVETTEYTDGTRVTKTFNTSKRHS